MDAGIQIVSQQQTTAKDQAGDYVPVVRVTFRVDGNGPFYVDVPVPQFTADAVDKLVSAYAAHVRQTAALGTK